MDPSLEEFIRHARERQLGLADLRAILQAAGWKDRQIARALSHETLALPVPEPPGAGSAREVFLHLFAFAALYTWVTSLVLLLFGYVDLALPDPAWRATDVWYEERESGIRVGMATLIVTYPLFLLVWRHLLAVARRDPQRGAPPVRRWLIWLSLFVGAVTLSSDLITLLYFLLEGEVSARFLLKVGTLLLIAGAGTGYLWWSLRSGEEAPR
ncbi:MAG: hypothetical protein IPM29_28175 [Planctomycetes bacterium]|nr:hypothetical protein [Planctomycetota bacterium]